MIIAISGKIGSGKDTVGEIIQYLTLKDLPNRPDYVSWRNAESYSNKVLQELSQWRIRKFADALKEICSRLTGIPRELFEKQEVKDSLLGEEWQTTNDYIKETTNSSFDLAEAYGYDWKETKLKSVHERVRIKEECLRKAREDGWRLEDNDIWILPGKEYTKNTVRWLLQTVGTEAMRNRVHQNVWVNALFADYKIADIVKAKLRRNGPKPSPGDVAKTFPNWIITDMRFPNELEAAKKHDGLTLRVNRKLSLRFPKEWNDYKESAYYELTEENFLQWIKDRNPKLHAAITHPSETSLDNARFNVEIENNGTLNELVEKLRIILYKAGKYDITTTRTV